MTNNLTNLLSLGSLVSDFLLNCKYGVLQYVVLKIFCTFLTIILQTAGVYDNGSFRLDRGYFYVAFIANFSQCWALYVLVKLYFAGEVKEQSEPHGLFKCWSEATGTHRLPAYKTNPHARHP